MVMAKKFSFNTEKFARYGFRLAYIDSDFLGWKYTFYFVPISSNLTFLSEMALLCHEIFGRDTSMIVNDERYPVVFKGEIFV